MGRCAPSEFDIGSGMSTTVSANPAEQSVHVATIPQTDRLAQKVFFGGMTWHLCVMIDRCFWFGVTRSSPAMACSCGMPRHMPICGSRQATKNSDIDVASNQQTAQAACKEHVCQMVIESYRVYLPGQVLTYIW